MLLSPDPAEQGCIGVIANNFTTHYFTHTDTDTETRDKIHTPSSSHNTHTHRGERGITCNIQHPTSTHNTSTSTRTGSPEWKGASMLLSVMLVLVVHLKNYLTYNPFIPLLSFALSRCTLGCRMQDARSELAERCFSYHQHFSSLYMPQ